MVSAIVVYDPWYGCTRAASEQIATGLSLDGRVATVVASAHEVSALHVLEHDIIVLGSPDHHGGPTAVIERLLNELRTFDLREKRFAFFETGYGRYRGRVTTRMEALLRNRNPLVSSPFLSMSVVVGRPHGPLLAGQLSNCREFGRSIRMALPLPA